MFLQWCATYFHRNIMLFTVDLNSQGTYILAYVIMCPPDASLEDSVRAFNGLPPLDPTIDCTQPICLLWGTVNPSRLHLVTPELTGDLAIDFNIRSTNSGAHYEALIPAEQFSRVCATVCCCYMRDC